MQVVSDFLKDSRVQITAVCDVQDRHYRERKWGQGKELGLEPARRTIDEHYAPASHGGLGFSGEQTGWLVSTMAIGAIISTMFAGHLADRLVSSEILMAVFH